MRSAACRSSRSAQMYSGGRWLCAGVDTLGSLLLSICRLLLLHIDQGQPTPEVLERCSPPSNSCRIDRKRHCSERYAYLPQPSPIGARQPYSIFSVAAPTQRAGSYAERGGIRRRRLKRGSMDAAWSEMERNDTDTTICLSILASSTTDIHAR